MADPDFAADYLALRAANDLVRERGRQWISDTLNRICLEFGPEFQIASQADWRFEVGKAVMMGDRIGIRYRGQTLLVEVGWPREPAHGFVADQGLARGRISHSASPILTARPIEELILKHGSDSGERWYAIKESRLGEELTETRLRGLIKSLQEV